MPTDVLTNDATRAHWRAAFAERARSYWTPARTAELARGKRMRLVPAEASTLLRALGLLHRDASMPPHCVRKYWQITHMVALLEPALRTLHAQAGGARPLRLLDAGCGRSYLTLLLAYVGTQPGGTPVRVLGVDHDAAVIAECGRRTSAAGLAQVVRGHAQQLATLDLVRAWSQAFPDDDVGATPVDGVVALHACDTATCDAIALGVRLRAGLIAVAPCCQAELARGWGKLDEAHQAGAFAPVWQSPHLRRELAAHLTDVMRTVLLRQAGYAARPIELVPDEHTRKNTLIIAPRTTPDAAAAAQYAALVTTTGGVGLALAARLA